MCSDEECYDASFLAELDALEALALEKRKHAAPAQEQPARLALGPVAASERPSAACALARGGAGKENAGNLPSSSTCEADKEGPAAHMDDDEVHRRRQLEREVKAREDRLFFQENEQRMARKRQERALEQQRQEIERKCQDIDRRRAALEQAEEEVARAREQQKRREQEQERRPDQSRKRRKQDAQEVVVIASDDVIVIEDDTVIVAPGASPGATHSHPEAQTGVLLRPEHWQASSEHVAWFEVQPGSEEHAKVVSILEQDAHKARSRGSGVCTDAYEVAKLERIQNNLAWATYNAHKSVLVQKGSDPQEVWAVHGECENV